MRRSAFVGSVCAATTALLAGCSPERPTSLSPTEVEEPSLAVIGERRIPNQYIVRLRDDVGDVGGLAAQLARGNGGVVERVYTRAIKGFALRLPDAAAPRLALHPLVEYVEQDASAMLFVEQSNPPSWGLDRVDQLALPLNQRYAYNADGSGVNVYIFDTGVRLSHGDFGSRAKYVPAGAAGNTQGDFVGDGHGSAADCHGHGTHVAGSAAGSSYGVAKNANIWAARVVNCSGGGQASMLIAALDWCVTGCVKPAVVNMSLGYGNVQSVRDAARRVAEAGVNTVSAAGNGNFFGMPVSACSGAPGGEPTTNTVGSTTSTDNESSFSNYGSCVDILAPGSAIVSAGIASDDAMATMSGTSMATPHVVGAIALYLQGNPNASAAEASAAMVSNAIAGTITLHSGSSSNGTPNRFLNTSWIAAGPPPPPPPAPDAPANLTAGAVGHSQINLSWWDVATTESGYRIERCTGASCTDFALLASVGANAASYSNTGLSAATTYTYRVYAYNAGGNSAYSAPASATTGAAPPVNNPPVAKYTWRCGVNNDGRTCDFDGSTSNDGDGGKVSAYFWDFRNRSATSTLEKPRYRFSSSGTYRVRLRVTDQGGLQNTVECSVRTGLGRTGSC